jgi:hypothetical protein
MKTAVHKNSPVEHPKTEKRYRYPFEEFHLHDSSNFGTNLLEFEPNRLPQQPLTGTPDGLSRELFDLT